MPMWWALAACQGGAIDVAIVGAGAGGTAAAYFLKKLRPDINIDLFERRSHAGGRTFFENALGVNVETGASIMIEENKYMHDWVEEMGLEKNEPSDNPGRSLISNGTNVVFDLNSGMFNWLWRYGLTSLWKTRSLGKQMINDFSTIYELQDQGVGYKTAEALWGAVGMLNFARQNCAKYFEELGVNQITIDELIGGATRANYNQIPKNITVLPCAISIAVPASKGVFSVKEGNMSVLQKVLDSLKINARYKTYVHGFNILGERNSANNRFELQFGPAPRGCGPRGDWGDNFEKGVMKRTYDALIIATPQYFDEKPQFNQTLAKLSLPPYKHIYATFVCGKAWEGDDVDEILFDQNDPGPVDSFGKQRGNCTNGDPLWKLKSTEKLSDEQINEYLNRTDLRLKSEYEWYAFPKYQGQDFPSLEFAPGAYYVPALEGGASSLEVAAVAGRNAVILLHDYLKAGLYGRKNESDTSRETQTYEVRDYFSAQEIRD